MGKGNKEEKGKKEKDNKKSSEKHKKDSSTENSHHKSVLDSAKDSVSNLFSGHHKSKDKSSGDNTKKEDKSSDVGILDKLKETIEGLVAKFFDKPEKRAEGDEKVAGAISTVKEDPSLLQVLIKTVTDLVASFFVGDKNEALPAPEADSAPAPAEAASQTAAGGANSVVTKVKTELDEALTKLGDGKGFDAELLSTLLTGVLNYVGKKDAKADGNIAPVINKDAPAQVTVKTKEDGTAKAVLSVAPTVLPASPAPTVLSAAEQYHEEVPAIGEVHTSDSTTH